MSTSNSLDKRYAAISTVILLMSSQKRTASGGDVDRPNVKGTNPNGMNRKKNNLKSL
jgi:hypothetical protein